MEDSGIFDANGEKVELIERKLKEPIPAEKLSTRKGPGGTEVTYMEAHDVFETANEIFGYDGWACRIVSIETHEESDGKGQWSCYAAATARVFTKKGKDMGHEDTGTKTLKGPNKFEVMGNVRKSAVSDAKKRAMRLFGNSLGNMCYDKDQVHASKRKRADAAPPPPRPPQPPGATKNWYLDGVDVNEFNAPFTYEEPKPPPPRPPPPRLAAPGFKAPLASKDSTPAPSFPPPPRGPPKGPSPC